MAQKRWSTIQSFWIKEYTWLWLIPGLIFGGVIGFLVGIASTADADNWFINGFWPELLGTAMSVVIIDRLVDYRAQIRETERLKKRLIREASSQSNKIAKEAIDEIRYEGWLTVNDDVHLLKGADLNHANLKGARLGSSNLQDANLLSANLEDSDLLSANLEGAYLNYANLSRAKLGCKLQGASLKHANMEDVYLNYANLEDAKLDDANLQNVDLRYVNLRGTALIFTNLQGAKLDNANLQNADLRYANLHDAKFNDKTVLPDSKYWTPETDMDRYTEPNHPDFWQPDWVKQQKEQYDQP